MDVKDWVHKEKNKLMEEVLKFGVGDEFVNSCKSTFTFEVENHPLLKFRIHFEICNPTNQNDKEDE